MHLPCSINTLAFSMGKVKLIEWGRFPRKLLKLNKSGGVLGRQPFHPILGLKAEWIAYLDSLTERQVEVYVNENLPA